MKRSFWFTLVDQFGILPFVLLLAVLCLVFIPSSSGGSNQDEPKVTAQTLYYVNNLQILVIEDIKRNKLIYVSRDFEKYNTSLFVVDK